MKKVLKDELVRWVPVCRILFTGHTVTLPLLVWLALAVLVPYSFGVFLATSNCYTLALLPSGMLGFVFGVAMWLRCNVYQDIQRKEE